MLIAPAGFGGQWSADVNKRVWALLGRNRFSVGRVRSRLPEGSAAEASRRSRSPAPSKLDDAAE